jgi:hypothetical protein
MSPVRTLVAVLTATVLCLALPAWAPAADAPAIDGLKYFPDDTNAMWIVHMDKLLATDGYKKLCKEIPMFEKEGLEGFRKEFGFAMSDVSTILFGGNARREYRPLGVFVLKKAVKAETILKAHTEPRYMGDKGRKYKEEKIGTLTVYIPEEEYGQAFCLVNEKTLVMSRVKELKEALGRNKRAEFSAGVQSDTGADVILLMDTIVFTVDKPPMIPGVDYEKLVQSASGGFLTIKISGNDVALRGAMLCRDAKGVEEVNKQAEALRTFLTAEMKKAPPNVVPKEILDLPGMVKLSSKENRVDAAVTIKDDTIITFIKLWLVPQPIKPIEKPPVEKKP